jgi:hypothetical protein
MKVVERMPRVCKAVKAKGDYFFGYYMIPYVLFHSFDVFIVFYNVENSKKLRKTLE